jgi:glycosyltransferase involved in cell wall biosynthesis
MSIVTPSYNQGQFIEETIRSVLLQGYPNLEYIVIDGGSTDTSVEIITKYEPWLTHWVSEPDDGLSHAINKGWERSTGEILAWLNSDDLYLPTTLGKVVATATRHPSAILIYGLGEHVDDSGATSRIVGQPYDVVDSLRSGRRAAISQPAAFVRRSGLEKVGLLDVRLKLSMDKDLWQRLAAVGEVRFVPDVWARFRLHERQTTQTLARDNSFSGFRERLLELDNLFALEGLSPEIVSLKRRAQSYVHIGIAGDDLVRGDCLSACKHALAAVSSPAFDREWFRYWAFALAGPERIVTLSNWKRKLRTFLKV